MSPKFVVRITAAAENDLEQIVEAVSARVSTAAAYDLLEQLQASVATLETLPDRGATPSELAQLGIKEFRQLVFQNYRMIYRVMAGRVFVLVIADGRQDMQQLLERRLLHG